MGARFSALVQTGPGAHPTSCTMGTGNFLGVTSGRGVTLTPHPLQEKVELYLYSPYGPYGLYRASVPVQGCTLPYSRAIPLLPLWAVRPVQSLSRTIPLFPLWAVRPVQSLSACTRVHFTFTHRVEIWVSRRTSLEDLERTESLSSAENRTAIRRSSTP